MIVTLLLTILNSFLGFMLGFLPNGTLPTGITTAVSYFVGLANSFSYVIPVQTLFQAFVVVVGVDIAILAWHLMNWVIRKIPGMQ